MSRYVILVHDHGEDGWARKSELEKAATYARDGDPVEVRPVAE